MSGLSIDHGGAIAVDSEVLREAGRRLDEVGVGCGEARAALRDAHRVIVDTAGVSAMVDTVSLWAVGEEAGAIGEECRAAASATLLMADAFEYVELQAAAELWALTDPDRARGLRWSLERLASRDERIAPLAEELVEGWSQDRLDGLDSQQTYLGLLAPLFSTAAIIGTRFPHGVIPPGSTLTGRADPVRITPVRTSTPAGAPSGLAGALHRMPGASGAQVAVEKYTFRDGTTRFVAYVAGTRNAIPWQSGGAEPWDIESNLELYTGAESESYRATVEALELAGAQQGDVVDVVGYSQGGMVASRLAMEGGFEVEVTVLAGSPVHPTLTEDQTLVTLAHTDDIVTALAGGGSPGGTGSADSFRVTAERGALDDALNPFDPHLLGSYVELAERADGSGDPRVEKLEGHWAMLDGAETIERTEYHAERKDEG